MSDYPNTVRSVLRHRMKYDKLAVAVTRAYAKMKPWRGSRKVRINKMWWLVVGLSAVYGVPAPQLRFEKRSQRSSSYNPDTDEITIRGKLSVVTLLHDFGHHLLGRDEVKVCKWSINLFRKCFPRSYRKCQHVGHTLKRD